MPSYNKQINGTRLIRKYPGRRLYDTNDSKYIVFSDVKKLIQEGVELQVVEVKTGVDVTRNILLQIILDQENDINPIFSVETLRAIIGFYGHSMQAIMGSHLEKSFGQFLPLHTKATKDTQKILNAYLDQVKDTYLKMQEKISKSNNKSTQNNK
ncbi:polyhydroxyalkanoate synthesis repressor PhaR [Polynucleobacter paneuropaeus]|nr:polyhydroxyalkanoate synthesis repressor PhaR [Polynucleobacter paneuropaeus]